MTEFSFHAEFWLPRPRTEIFSFFADPLNLQEITPEWLHFKVLTHMPMELEKGSRIDYKLRVHGIPMHWTSEITAWKPPYRFVDEQRHGPYQLWIHEHRFEDQSRGTLCLDHVRYATPGGRLANWLFVRRDIRRIFEFRQKRLRERFGNSTNEDASS